MGGIVASGPLPIHEQLLLCGLPHFGIDDDGYRRHNPLLLGAQAHAALITRALILVAALALGLMGIGGAGAIEIARTFVEGIAQHLDDGALPPAPPFAGRELLLLQALGNRIRT